MDYADATRAKNRKEAQKHCEKQEYDQARPPTAPAALTS